jgi:hypothetical protein
LGNPNDSLTDSVRFGGARKMKQNYLDEKRTGDKGNVGNEAQDTITPPKPEDAVVDGKCETGFLVRLLSPFLLALLLLTSDCPPDALEAGWGFAVGEPSVVFRSFPLAFLEGGSDPLRDGARGTVVLQLVEIGGFERTGASESHEGTDPLGGDDACQFALASGMISVSSNDSLRGGGLR